MHAGEGGKDAHAHTCAPTKTSENRKDSKRDSEGHEEWINSKKIETGKDSGRPRMRQNGGRGPERGRKRETREGEGPAFGERQKPQEEEGPGRGTARPRGDRTTGRQVSSASTHVTGRGGESPWGRGWGAADADLRAPPLVCSPPLLLYLPPTPYISKAQLSHLKGNMRADDIIQATEGSHM